MRLLLLLNLLFLQVSRSFVTCPSAVRAPKTMNARTDQDRASSSVSTALVRSLDGCETSAASVLRVFNVYQGYEIALKLVEKQPNDRRIILLCHGLLANEDSLAYISEAIDWNSARLAFGGNGASGGDWTYGGYEREISDVRTVVEYLRAQGWDVVAILGHSKGAAAVLQYAAKYDDVGLVFNMSGRFDTTKAPRSRFTEEQWAQLEKEGRFPWRVRGRTVEVTKQAFEERAALDMDRTSRAIRRSWVHTIHGTKDETIPVADAVEFSKVIEKHSMDLIEGASHSFVTPPEKAALVEAISRRLSSFVSETPVP